MNDQDRPVELTEATFSEIVLPAEYEHFGHEIASEKQRRLIEELAKEPMVLFAMEFHGINLDIFGPVELQHSGNEDRLLFPKNGAHIHVPWPDVKRAQKVEHQRYCGITFHDREGVLLFGYWLSKPQDFSPQVHELLGDLL